MSGARIVQKGEGPAVANVIVFRRDLSQSEQMCGHVFVGCFLNGALMKRAFSDVLSDQ